MLKIKFSDEYPKLWEQRKAQLLDVRILDAQAVAINKRLIEYDTKKSDGTYYPLPKTGKLIQLVFIGDYDIPFCTLRRHTDKKYLYYMSLKGEILEVART